MSRSERQPVRRGARVEFTFEGRAVACYEGETVAAALLAAGVEAFGVTGQGEIRAPLCNMGTCFDCSVRIGECQLTRACLTPVASGMDVRQAKRY